MMHRIRYGGGAKTLYHVPRDRYARAGIVAAPTYAIFRGWKSEDSSEREAVASTSATVDSASASLTAAAGPAQSNPRLLTVNDESDFTAGHHYLLYEGELAELVTCERTDTSQVRLMSELRHNYTTSATLAGVEISGSFPSDDANSETDLESGGGPYLVAWSYTLNGVPYYPLEDAWVTRFDAQPLITTEDLLVRWPEAASMVAERWSLENAIVSASLDWLADMEAYGEDPHGMRHHALTTVCVADRALETLHRWSKTPTSLELARDMRQDYERRLAALTTGQRPKRTADVKQPTGTSTQGGSRDYGKPLQRRS